MNILLTYPTYPDTYWSFRHALRFISKKAAIPPLGLITVSAMLPEDWNKRLVDLNVSSLKSSDILWADYVLISAMSVQKESADEIIKQCIRHGKKIIAGGPLFTQEFKQYPMVDHLVLNEAELTLPLFLHDLQQTHSAKHIYQTEKFADMTMTPVPDYHLLERKNYAAMNLQVTRGCPYDCDFCEITSLLGHKVRMKETLQVINELQRLYDLNWHGTVSIVDDNFIGNKKHIKNELLPAMQNWMKQHRYPFTFNIQSSVNLADDESLMKQLTDTGFDGTFIGIETPDEVSLNYCNKIQNQNRDLVSSVKKIQQAGLRVSGGFIVGFDSDTPSVFERQTEFIQRSGIVNAMVGLLNAPKNTTLYYRLQAENRLTSPSSGNNTDYSMNFIPKMNRGILLEGYRSILENIYSVKPFYKRIRRFLLNYKKQTIKQKRFEPVYLLAFLKLVVIIGFLNKGRREFWRFLMWTLVTRPAYLIDALTFAVYGYHFRTVYRLND